MVTKAARRTQRARKSRDVLARKLDEIIGEQLDAIQHVQKLIGAEGEAGEAARAAAALSRSLRETRDMIQPPDEEARPHDDDAEESFPYDVEQFRDQLARALEGIIEERAHELQDRSAEADPEAASAQRGEAAD